MGRRNPDDRIKELAKKNTTEAINAGCILLQQRYGLPVTGKN